MEKSQVAHVRQYGAAIRAAIDRHINGRSLAKAQWDAERFGLSFSKIRERARYRSREKVLIVSIPKAGTHLIERLICLVPGYYRKMSPTVTTPASCAKSIRGMRPGQVVCCHVPFDANLLELAHRHSIRVFFVHRDPLDILVSRVYYIRQSRSHWLHRRVTELSSWYDQLNLLIVGDKHGCKPLENLWSEFMPWNQAAELSIAYEDVIDEATRITVVSDVLARLAPEYGEMAHVSAISEKIISGSSPTFRAGSAGEGKELVPEDLAAAVNAVCDRPARYRPD